MFGCNWWRERILQLLNSFDKRADDIINLSPHSCHTFCFIVSFKRADTRLHGRRKFVWACLCACVTVGDCIQMTWWMWVSERAKDSLHCQSLLLFSYLPRGKIERFWKKKWVISQQLSHGNRKSYRQSSVCKFMSYIVNWKLTRGVKVRCKSQESDLFSNGRENNMSWNRFYLSLTAL